MEELCANLVLFGPLYLRNSKSYAKFVNILSKACIKRNPKKQIPSKFDKKVFCKSVIVAPFSSEMLKATQNLSTYNRTLGSRGIKINKSHQNPIFEELCRSENLAPYSSETVKITQNLSTYYRKLRLRGIQRNKFH